MEGAQREVTRGGSHLNIQGGWQSTDCSRPVRDGGAGYAGMSHAATREKGRTPVRAGWPPQAGPEYRQGHEPVLGAPTLTVNAFQPEDSRSHPLQAGRPPGEVSPGLPGLTPRSHLAGASSTAPLSSFDSGSFSGLLSSALTPAATGVDTAPAFPSCSLPHETPRRQC